MGVGDVVEAMHAVHGVMGDGGELAAYAIGDAAVRVVLDGVEAWQRELAGTRVRESVKVRIEHAEVVDAADVGRFRALGVTASLQPCHLLADVGGIARYLPHRLDRVLPIRDLIASGLVPGRSLVFGSDVPDRAGEPWSRVLATTTRKRADMPCSAAESRRSRRSTRGRRGRASAGAANAPENRVVSWRHKYRRDPHPFPPLTRPCRRGRSPST